MDGHSLCLTHEANTRRALGEPPAADHRAGAGFPLSLSISTSPAREPAPAPSSPASRPPGPRLGNFSSEQSSRRSG